MLKNSCKINDTFSVKVEIVTADAIIVSANINSVTFRGTLIRCNKNNSCLFKKIPDKQSSFSANRLDLKALKRQIKYKSFSSNYNLRKANGKIIKSKQNVKKSETKDVKTILFSKKPLSIKLKKDNGVYINASNVTKNDNIEESKLTSLGNESFLSQVDRTSNVIKIVKTKVTSNKYQYSIINKYTDNSNYFDGDIQRHSQTKVLKLCLTPIPADFLPSSSDSCSINSLILDNNPHQDVKLDKINKVVEFVNIKEKTPIEALEEKEKNPVKIEIIDEKISSTSEKSRKISMSNEKKDILENQSKIEDKSLSSTKLKFIKNRFKPNSYTIKSSDKVGNSISSKCHSIMKRYNCKKFRIGDIVWAKLSGYSIWPAKVIDLYNGNDNATVMWLGDDYRTSELLCWKLWDFGAHFHEKFNKKGKGNYMNAVQQAQVEYSKLDFSDCNNSCFFDISSESSTLESVNIDDNSCELDRLLSSSQELKRPSVYLPLPEEEFELMKSISKSGISDFLSFDSPGSQQQPDCSIDTITHHHPSFGYNDQSSVPLSAKFHLMNPNNNIDNNINYNII